MAEITWSDVLQYPISGRKTKPRKSGLTMVIDKGLGLLETREMMELAAPHIDFLKLGFGTSALYSSRLLQDKIRLVQSYGVEIYPGGTFLEVAVLQNKLDAYLEASKRLGYTTMEVSDGTITMSKEERAAIIQKVKKHGFKVISEVGKKDPRDTVSDLNLAGQIEEDMASGASLVIIEGRESGKGVVIYDAEGNIKEEELERLRAAIRQPQAVIWEAPQKHQQQELILRFGPNVNLGNIQSGEVLSLEALRLGLRGDTLRAAMHHVKSLESDGQELMENGENLG